MLGSDAEDDDPIGDEEPQPTAVLIRPEDLSARSLLGIWRNMHQAYYVTPCWRPDFYTALAYCGFISVSQAVPTRSGGEPIPLLIPEIQRSYGILRFDDLHIERNVRKRAGRYVLRFDTMFDNVLAALCAYHDNCWLLPEYCTLLRTLHACGPVDIGLSTAGAQLRVHSVELIDRATGRLVAGELGYAIGSVFTSLTGFTGEGQPSVGKIQLVGLACVLRAAGCQLWNLGHPPREASERGPASMLYKKEMGVTVVPRRVFLKAWVEARDQPLMRLPPAGIASHVSAGAPCDAGEAGGADAAGARRGARAALDGGRVGSLAISTSGARAAGGSDGGSDGGSVGGRSADGALEAQRGIDVRSLIDAWPQLERRRALPT
ncbi:hypothetical protein KFE25_000143 [Diacronema lutheri]|uniref:Uncharacterized protein n=1 Tax=Diacronema lutheri TaxID=2081491 RepID=A0A8J5XR94_DIALT|nr:hypothetical protein KFE25_000143 [Diacronema lutheri]